jgi:hypothetical protein
MERVSKRFILYSSRDEKVRESDFDELKEKLQFARYEMMNGVKEFRENLIRYSSMVRDGLLIVSDKVLNKKELSHAILRKRNEFKSTQKMLNRQKCTLFKFNNFSQLIVNNEDDYTDEEEESAYGSIKNEFETNAPTTEQMEEDTEIYNNVESNQIKMDQSNQDDVSIKQTEAIQEEDEEYLIS